MALTIRTVCRNSLPINNITKQIRSSIFSHRNNVRLLFSEIQYPHSSVWKVQNVNKPLPIHYRQFSEQPQNEPLGSKTNPEDKKPGLVERFKQMYKDYWYILVPVHLVTSAVWFGSFYYAVRSGLDVIGILESMNISDKYLEPLRESRAGYFALAFAMYKLATPLRYTVTLGGTTYAIKRLVHFGLIKPVPSRERLKELFQEKKDNMQDKKNQYQTKMIEKKTKVMDEVRKYKKEMRSLKDKVKKGM